MLGISLITLYRKGKTENWDNTLVENGVGVIMAKNQNVTSVVGNDFFHVMETSRDANEKLSETQKEKISERLNNVGSKIKDFSVFKDWESDFNIIIDE